MVELTQMVRQQGDNSFIELLNKIQKEDLDEKVDKALLLRFVSKGTSNYPNRAVHIFTENNPADQYNEIMLEDTDQSLVCLNAIDVVPKGCERNESQLESIKKRKLSDARNLATLRKLKIRASIMLTVNILLVVRLVNGLVVVDMDFKVVNNEVKIVFVIFENEEGEWQCRIID